MSPTRWIDTSLAGSPKKKTKERKKKKKKKKKKVDYAACTSCVDG